MNLNDLLTTLTPKDIHFTSDTHFCHEKIISLCNRPYSDANYMNESIIKHWNETVKPNDLIFHLGDMFHYSPKTNNRDECLSILNRLNGKIILINGNHDTELLNDAEMKSRFLFNVSYLEVTLFKKRFILMHYPIFEWNQYYRKSFHLHGHIHTTSEKNMPILALGDKYRINVNTEFNNYTPLTLENIRNDEKYRKNKNTNP